VRLDFEQAASVEEHVRALAKAPGETLPRLAKIIQPDAAGVAGRIVVRPNHPDFGRVVEDLDAAGFSIIELDMDGAYVANPHLEPQSMLDGMSRSAVYYAERLLKQHYFRLDPIAALFWRIYNGAPVRRFDPAGTNELAVDAGGSIYPCRLMLGMAEHRLGFVADASLDEEKLRRFDDVGAATTSECMRCWARHLCGGGTASVHQALSGSFRTPHIPWCDAQRAWMAAAVCAFQALTSQGVHFDRVYRTLGRKEKPSLFTLARAALTMTIGVRPIEEADAKMLTQWENWNEAAYFVFNETGLFLATKYDREMDSLHPRGIDHELILIRKTGEPFGLLKIRPERIAQAAGVWIYFRDEADYASDAIRRGFRAILKEAGGQHALRRLTVPVSPKERGLAAFLEAVGFVQEGVLREALFLHGEYHDVALYGIATDRL
jgi:radical SAM protein with 4Fe4S-binding SPASM domain